MATNTRRSASAATRPPSGEPLGGLFHASTYRRRRQVYAELEELERRGLVKREINGEQRYELTRQGRRRLEALENQGRRRRS